MFSPYLLLLQNHVTFKNKDRVDEGRCGPMQSDVAEAVIVIPCRSLGNMVPLIINVYAKSH